ncbi:MAG: Rho-binding antiterminator [Candidatus Sedimenticola endophacoides]
MSSAPYHPIPCALHSEYEWLAMRGAVVRVRLGDGTTLDGRARDVTARAEAEYLHLEHHPGELLELRLDRIAGIKPL